MLLLELGVLGIIYIVISFLEYGLVVKDLKQFHIFKTISILIFVIGILVHTFGDVLGSGTPLELQLETAGHFIIMVGSIIIILQSINLLKVAEEFGYG